MSTFNIEINIYVICTFFIFFYGEPTNAQLIAKLLYCSYIFRHYYIILRELVVSTLLSYTSRSMQSLVIQFKISNKQTKKCVKFLIVHIYIYIYIYICVCVCVCVCVCIGVMWK